VGSNSLDAWWERVAARIRRPIGRQILLRDGHVRELERLGRSCRNGSGGGPRVLVVALRNWTTHTAYESVIAQGLRLRGAKVALVTCGGGQPLCELGWSRRLYPLPCDRCAWFTDRVAAAARLQTFRLADQFAWAGDGRRAPESPDALGPTTIDPREAADISVPWVLRTPEIEAAPEGLAAANDLAVSAAAVEGVARRILQEFSPEVKGSELRPTRSHREETRSFSRRASRRPCMTPPSRGRRSGTNRSAHRRERPSTFCW
jgi:hypothetical protein